MGCGIRRRWMRSCGIWLRRSERPVPRIMQRLRLHECGKGCPGRTVMLAMLRRFCCGGLPRAFLRPGGVPQAAEVNGPMGTIIIREMVGTSPDSFSDAVRHAVQVASRTVRNIREVEVVKSTARVVDGQIAEYRVELKIHFEYEGGH